MYAPSVVEQRGPLLAFGVLSLVWGSTFLAIKVGNDTAPPIWSCAMRLVLAAVLLNILLVAIRQPFPKGEALKAALCFGAIEFGVQLPLLYWGEKTIPSGLAALIYAISPIAAIFSAKAMGVEDWNLPKLGAACMAFVGVAIIFWHEVTHGVDPAGILAVVLAAWLGPLAGLVLQRGPKQGAIGINAAATLIAAPIALIASLALGESPQLPTTISEAAPIIYLSVMGSVVAFGLFAWLVNRWNTTTVSFLGVIVPVVAVILGALVRKEQLAPGAWVGALIVLIGVVFVLRLESQQKLEAAAT